jgi:glycosyltransferase involved in cell wall biosynthesis
MTDKPIADVCVIVPNYNNGRYLDEFIQSVMNSTVEPFTLLVVDDGSTDNSAEVLKKYSSLHFLKVICLKTNQGLTTALNIALDNAKGKYIMRADPDDLLHPEKLKRQYDFMENHPEVDILGCNVLYFSDKRSKINTSNFPLKHDKIVKTYRRGEHGVQHPTVFIRSNVYKQYRYQPIFPGEDYEILARMARDGYRFANLSEQLYFMRVHAGSSTSNLKFSGIKNTFDFRDQLFGTKTGKLKMRLYYLHIRHYRKFQIAGNPLMRVLHLLSAVMLYPRKFLSRIFRFNYETEEKKST